MMKLVRMLSVIYSHLVRKTVCIVSFSVIFTLVVLRWLKDKCIRIVYELFFTDRVKSFQTSEKKLIAIVNIYWACTI